MSGMIKANGSVAGAAPPEIALPGEGDIAAIRALSAEMPGASVFQRAAEAASRGLLRDLSPCFRSDGGKRSAFCAGRRIGDARLLVERFQEAVDAIGFDTGDAADASGQPGLSIRECVIEGGDLSGADILAALDFEHCTWNSPGSFVGARFRRRAGFIGCVFTGETNFFAAIFEAGAMFGGAEFHRCGDFRGAHFAGEVSFFRSNFRESLELRFATFADDSVLNFQELRFTSSTAMGGSLHLHSHQLRRRSGLRLIGRIAGESSANPRDMADACEQYGELEANFAAQGSPDAAEARDWCHYRYMDLRRRSRRRAADPRRFLDWLFMKWCFGYGVYTKRILITGLLLIAFFALSYATSGFGLPSEQWAVQYGGGTESRLISDGTFAQRISDSLYFSAVTFATVGYGDWHPMHWAKLAGAAEGMLGVFVMSVFTVSFARKLLR